MEIHDSEGHGVVWGGVGVPAVEWGMFRQLHRVNEDDAVRRREAEPLLDLDVASTRDVHDDRSPGAVLSVDARRQIDLNAADVGEAAVTDNRRDLNVRADARDGDVFWGDRDVGLWPRARIRRP